MNSVGPWVGFLIVATMLLVPAAAAYLVFQFARPVVYAKAGEWGPRICAGLACAVYVVLGLALLVGFDSTGVLGERWVGD